ncbi:Protein SPA, chloroplastic [Vitis vinifera]|uniref:Protein SPA, chloroplastic n=1 Tax=Vitis vinifera TaxID=29760 RepID=A0A438J2U2_VITVI|nr:Protein SPA, chloroplastic [Vitis vinifera]
MPTPHAYPKPSTQTQMSLSSNSGLHWIGAESKTSTAEMSIAPSLPRLHSSFICCPLKLSSPSPSLSHKFARNQRSPASYPRIRALDLDQNTIVAISVGVVSVAVGIGVPIFYETQIDNAAKRENTQPCFPCDGSGAQRCRFCMGTGNVTVVLGGDEKEVSRCINCDGAGSLTCTTCQGSGIQPRYLDRRYDDSL